MELFFELFWIVFWICFFFDFFDFFEKRFGFKMFNFKYCFEILFSPSNRSHSQLFKNMLISTFGRTYLSARPQKWKNTPILPKNTFFLPKNTFFCQNGEILKILGENFGNSYCEFFIKVGSRSVYLSTYRLKSIWQKQNE